MTLQEHMRSAAQITSDAMSELLIGGAERIAALEAALEQARVALKHWQMDYGVQNEGADPPRHAEETRAALRKIEEVRK